MFLDLYFLFKIWIQEKLKDISMFYIACYLALFALPSIIIDIFQIKHIKIYQKKDPIILNPKDYEIAAKYSLENLRLSIVSTCIDFIVFCCWVVFGLGILQSFFQEDSMLESVAFVLSFLVISSLLSLPIKAYQNLFLDKKYGFSVMNVKLFLIDTLKSIGLMLVLGFIILWVLLNIMEYENWWLAGFGVIFIVLLLLNMLYPTLIAPIFNTFTPLDDEVLGHKIQDLMQRAGFYAKGIFVMDASRRDGRLNAYFGGFGRTKRVVLFDTLLDKVSSEGLLAILGHELGHFKHKDIIKNVGIMGVVLFILFFIAGHLHTSFFISLGLEQNSPTTLVVLFLIVPIVSFWVMPLIGYFSRKAEYRADSYGASLTSKQHLKEALIRLVNENKTFPHSHPLYVFFHYTHPPLLDRLCALK